MPEANEPAIINNNDAYNVLRHYNDSFNTYAFDQEQNSEQFIEISEQ